jgi:hypothetical protein
LLLEPTANAANGWLTASCYKILCVAQISAATADDRASAMTSAAAADKAFCCADNRHYCVSKATARKQCRYVDDKGYYRTELPMQP